MSRIDQTAISTSPTALNTTDEFINPSVIYLSVLSRIEFKNQHYSWSSGLLCVNDLVFICGFRMVLTDTSDVKNGTKAPSGSLFNIKRIFS
jgi:hypothetical protein